MFFVNLTWQTLSNHMNAIWMSKAQKSCVYVLI